jgi:hypothetical protein
MNRKVPINSSNERIDAIKVILTSENFEIYPLHNQCFSIFLPQFY